MNRNNFRPEFVGKERDYMKVLDIITHDECDTYADIIDSKNETIHLAERNSRIARYQELGLLGTHFIDGFIVDKRHKNGNEVHLINDKGVIYIINERTTKLITILGARPGQIRRYYRDTNIRIDGEVQAVIDKAHNNTTQNNVNYE